MSIFRLTGYFDVGRLVDPSASVMSASFDVEERPESAVLVNVNGTLVPGVVHVLVDGTLLDPEN